MTLSDETKETLLNTLKSRFKDNQHRHSNTDWASVLKRLKTHKDTLYAIQHMEATGGEPDAIYLSDGNLYYVDCAKETPKGRRRVCYDMDALKSRKKYPPKTSAKTLAQEMGVTLLSEEDYITLQKVGPFDTKTSSWLETPDSLREKGGALFGDYRYGRTFIYHNGAESYYSVRGFRAKIKL